MKPVELSADEIVLLLQGLESLRFITSEVIAHEPSPGALAAESVKHLAFVEATAAKLETVLEQLGPADLPPDVVPTPAVTAPWLLTAEKVRELTAAGIDVEGYAAAENRRALDELISREASPWVDKDSPVAGVTDNADGSKTFHMKGAPAMELLCATHGIHGVKARGDRCGYCAAEPSSSACKRESWCCRQVGHPGDCAAIIMADGSVVTP